MTIVTSRFYASTDGLTLHIREHRPEYDVGRLPVVCLPGLTRGAVDFETLADALASRSRTPRRVLAFDYRGRGRSDHDPDWRHYDLATERADFMLELERDGITAAHFIGTSRGGLHVMALAETHRALIRGVVLNDIGPVIGPEGLRRIKGYVGKPAAPGTIDEAIELLKRGPGLGFDGLSDDEWRLFAATTFGDDPRDLRLRYDPQIARTLDGLEVTAPLPDNWGQFDLLRGAPLLTIRGANSDLLAADTQAAMAARWQDCDSMVVPGQGHAPLLSDRPTLARIDDFLAFADEVTSEQRGSSPNCDTKTAGFDEQG